MPNRKKTVGDTETDGILEQLLAELDQEIEAREGAVSRKITKGQALIKSMVNEALKGDQRMMASVMKLVEKLDALQANRKEEVKTTEELAKEDEDIILRYYAMNKDHLEKELQKRKKENPAIWAEYS